MSRLCALATLLLLACQGDPLPARELFRDQHHDIVQDAPSQVADADAGSGATDAIDAAADLGAVDAADVVDVPDTADAQASEIADESADAAETLAEDGVDALDAPDSSDLLADSAQDAPEPVDAASEPPGDVTAPADAPADTADDVNQGADDTSDTAGDVVEPANDTADAATDGAQDEFAAPDVAPPAAFVCAPCSDDGVCGPGGVCLAHGALPSFCGTDCSAGCAVGAACLPGKTLIGKEVMACQPAAGPGQVAGTCPCPVGGPEVCNGKDDDCNGLTDEFTCDDGNMCTADACVVLSGDCAHTPANGACTDGNACTIGDACGSGVCLPGALTDCTDGNVCTDDACDVTTGCKWVNNTAVCSDGDKCTQVDTCQAGSCVGASPVVCTASDQCHDVGVCLASTGICGNPNKTDGTPCSDGALCTLGDVCAGGVCAGSPNPCSDGNPCTVDACVAATGACQSAPCSDASACTTDVCVTGSGCVYASIGAQMAYAKASNTGAQDLFGHAVAIDGDTMVVGAAGEDSSATGVDGNAADNGSTDSGAAYVFVRKNGAWSQQAYLKASNTGGGDGFGSAVAVSGDTIVIGAQGEDGGGGGLGAADNSKVDSGAVYVFTRVGATWTQQTYVKASNPDAGDAFGSAVAISGDSIVVGAYVEGSSAVGVNGAGGDNSKASSGAAYVFTRAGSAWTQQAYLKASNTDAYDFFGNSVAISGDTVVVGAPGEDSNATGINGLQSDNSKSGSGAAYVFARSGATWSQQAYVKASNTDANDSFGFPVAISGDTFLAGAQGEASNATTVNGLQSDNSKPSSGAAYVFERSSGAWSPQAYLKATNTDSEDYFGSQLAIAGDSIAVGAWGESSAKAGIGSAGFDNGKTQAGAAYVFNRQGNAWSLQAYVKASNPDIGDDFAASVALAGNTLVVGASGEDSNAVGINGNQADNTVYSSGAAYIFQLNQDCDDGNACTLDGCAVATGTCTHTAASGACSDGDPCTVGDACSGGVCAPGAAPCDDKNVCTSDSCALGLCTHVTVSGPCDDGNACTLGDTCSSGACAGATSLTCDDSDPCTADSCNAGTGCVHTSLGVAVTCYYDKDGDGFGSSEQGKSACGACPKGYASNSSDCYDANSSAFPKQTAWFTADRGDGSFDYDCSGATDKQYTDVALFFCGLCGMCGSSTSTLDWQTVACGQTNKVYSSCSDACDASVALCQGSSSSRTQACH